MCEEEYYPGYHSVATVKRLHRELIELREEVKRKEKRRKEKLLHGGWTEEDEEHFWETASHEEYTDEELTDVVVALRKKYDTSEIYTVDDEVKFYLKMGDDK